MEWYGWILIVLALAAVGFVKMKVLSAWMAKRKVREEQSVDDA